jgi:hypothetical protein
MSLSVNGSEKPILLVYGNCQAGGVSAILGSDPALSVAYSVRYLPSFDDRVPGSRDLPLDVVGRTLLLLEQFDPNPFPFRDHLPAHCKTVVFPSVDLSLLWPLRCVNPFNDEGSEEFPWGHYPEGDRVIINCVQRGLSADETLAYYLAHAHEELPNLSRYLEIEKARLRAREANCDLTMSDFIFSGFCAENLFWCAYHPTMSPLRELCNRLVSTVEPALPEVRAADIDKTVALLPPQGPLGFLRVPIHPAIVDHFDMEWYRVEEGRNYGLRDSPVTYEDYLHGMAETAIKMQGSLAG